MFLRCELELIIFIPFDWNSEVISNDEARQMQFESADQVFQVLYEPIKKQGTLFVEKLGLSSNVLSPSMIAALTVLYTDKHQNTVHQK
jgi:lipid-A-disaccharide synthase